MWHFSYIIYNNIALKFNRIFKTFNIRTVLQFFLWRQYEIKFKPPTWNHETRTLHSLAIWLSINRSTGSACSCSNNNTLVYNWKHHKEKKMNSLRLSFFCVVVVLGALPYFSYAQLDPSFYASTCSNLSSIVREVLTNVSLSDPRMPASLIRLHFHGCFVQVTTYILHILTP